MKSTSTRIGLIIFCLAFSLYGVAFAKSPSQQGSVIVRVNDGTNRNRCIGSNDKLTVTLRRVILEKNSKWFGLVEDKNLGITLTTTVSGSSDNDSKSASFAKVVKEPVSQFKNGQISLSQEQNLLSKFSLTNGNNVFTVVGIDVGIIKESGKSTGAKILLGAVGATKSLSLPANPFTTAFGIASTYVDNVFAPLLDQAAEENEAISHHISMNIDSANCTGDDEWTGTKAIIAAANSPASGYVDTAKVNSYCFKSEITPSFSLKFAPIPDSGSCENASGYVDVKNSYLLFYVNSLTSEVPKDNNVNTAGLRLSPTLNLGLVESPPSAKDVFIQELPNVLQKQGFSKKTAKNFSNALFNNDIKTIAKAFKISPKTVESYRDTINRCIANDVSAKSCFQ